MKHEFDNLLRMLNRATAPASDLAGELPDEVLGERFSGGLEFETAALRQSWLGLCNLLEAADCQFEDVPHPVVPLMVERAKPAGLAAKTRGQSSRPWAVVAVAVSVLIAVAGTITLEVHKRADPVLHGPQDVAHMDSAQTKTPPTPPAVPREQGRDDRPDVAARHSQQPSQKKSASAPAADPIQPHVGKQRPVPSKKSPDAEMATAAEGSLRADSVDDEIAAVCQVTALVQHDWYVQSTNVGTIASGIDEMESEMSAGSL